MTELRPAARDPAASRPRLRAELLRHLRCTDQARTEERARCAHLVMAAWVELPDELEAGGPLMRKAVRDQLESLG